MMVKVLLYGYATGVFSSRAMARKREEDMAFRVLGAGNFPSHRTLSEFRLRHLGDFKGWFVEVVRVAREMGLARFGKVSIDGTKIRASASKHKAMSYARMGEKERELEAEVEALLIRARDTDAEEDARFGESLRGDELPEELRRREDRLAAIRAAKSLHSRKRGRVWRRRSARRTMRADIPRVRTATPRVEGHTSAPTRRLMRRGCPKRQWLDQSGPGTPAIQLTRLGQGAGGNGIWCAWR